ncbi:MAG TPA: branched-chain amino acid ABC transporter ATP-binding protein/permease [Gammaproteobacteria bacterium]|nr:branched-chain amino acid ABC transporter ATP-binding protein/permease [Gammaproteobacteria bacterium]
MFATEAPKHWPWILAFGLAYASLALVVDNSYYQLIMTNVLVWAVVGMAWNLLCGYSGLISFGHAAFFGLGAYFVVLAQVAWGLTPWIGIPIAGVLGSLAGLIVGVPTFRLRGHYFALAMLAYPLALLYVFEWLGHQEVAIPMERESPAAFMQFESGRVYIFIGLAFVLLAMGVTRVLEHSRYGMSLTAIKQDEIAAEASGIGALEWKLRAIALSGGMAAAIGGFYAVVQLIVTPLSVFGVLVSAQALIVVMFGGVATPWGAVIGAVTLVPLSAWLDARFGAELPGLQGVVYGIAIIAVILLAPEGVFWKLRDLLARKGLIADTATLAVTESAEAASARFRIEREGSRLLEVKNLNKTFGGLRAVDDVSLEVRRGEILGIIGPNGAGKTTLFNLINGFIRPDRGEVLLAGTRISHKRPNRICALGLGRTFQVVKPFARMSIADNVIIGAYVHAASLDEARRTARDALAVVGLGESAGHVAGGASNRNLRRMEIARALATRPEILLLDEVFAGLTGAETAELMELLRRLAGLGITLVIIEHTMKAMVRLVDRFVVLDHGRVLATGSPDEITRNPAVIEAYLGRKWLDDARA